MLYILQPNGVVIQKHMATLAEATEYASFYERSWAEWMDIVIFPCPK